MSILTKSWVKTLLRYTALFGAVAAGLAIYQNDSTPPLLEGFEVTNSNLDLARDLATFEFSGVITDDRSVSHAQFTCRSEEKTEFVIVIPTSGINKYQVSFGRVSSSPNWIGSWEGDKQHVSFSGIATLPKNTPSLQCIWFAELADNLGNRITTESSVVMSVKGN